MRIYWYTWAALFVFTILMLLADGASSSIPRVAFVLFMLVAMLLKATLIGSNFMHLRLERRSLAITVVVGLLITGTILYALIVPDAARIHSMAVAR